MPQKILHKCNSDRTKNEDVHSSLIKALEGIKIWSPRQYLDSPGLGLFGSANRTINGWLQPWRRDRGQSTSQAQRVITWETEILMWFTAYSHRISSIETIDSCHCRLFTWIFNKPTSYMSKKHRLISTPSRIKLFIESSSNKTYHDSVYTHHAWGIHLPRDQIAKISVKAITITQFIERVQGTLTQMIQKVAVHMFTNFVYGERKSDSQTVRSIWKKRILSY